MPQDLSAVDWPVRTTRLTIRPATVQDLPEMFEFRRLPEVAQWLPTLPTDRDAFVERLSDPDKLAVTLVVERDGRLVGDLFLHIGDPWAQAEVAEQAKGTQAELGWVLAPEHAGQGLATEAAAELLRICFEDLGLRRVVALCFADNVASWRIMEKLGMRREEHNVAESLHRSGRWLDGYGYALLADEWRSGRTDR
ncbi:GNAT family N-acetyltransferase [Nocardioides sp. MAHUQ-72]|uniref:GNAT family N-acetyltransferase n=1 Tax=unclassified Nocardioides TaxID=2615069 RepID=UPI00360A941C